MGLDHRPWAAICSIISFVVIGSFFSVSNFAAASMQLNLSVRFTRAGLSAVAAALGSAPLLAFVFLVAVYAARVHERLRNKTHDCPMKRNLSCVDSAWSSETAPLARLSSPTLAHVAVEAAQW